MKKLNYVFWIGLAAVVVACTTKSVHHKVSNEDKCLYNLTAIALQLRLAIPTEPDFPRNLGELSALTTNASIFVCPSTGHKPGNVQNVEDWTDYIYVGNLPEDAQDPRIALLICPPENHGGKYGYVGWLTREVIKLPATEIRRLVATPWCFATNTPADQIERLKKQVIVHTPKRLKPLYPDAYIGNKKSGSHLDIKQLTRSPGLR